mgnify:CR=1 FL=1
MRAPGGIDRQAVEGKGLVIDKRMKRIHDDLENTADGMEQLARGLAGHAIYLQNSVHADDAVEVNERVSGLNDSINELRALASSIEPR